MSSDKSEEDEHEVISKQIVDYYKKYSQNKQLPKYFSGTSLAYMPPIVKDDEISPKIDVISILDETNTETLVQKESVPEIQIEEPLEPKAVSPSSSITSNRKLEWDNGADIGYNNCNKNVKLHKSVSLPILLTSKDAKHVDKKVSTKLSREIVTVVSYCHDRGDIEQIQSSSSSPSYPAEVPIESSSSSFKTNPKPISSSSSSSFTNTIAYLKNKIGSPDAESTPKLPSVIPVYTETPIIPKRKKEMKRIINLCVTKPVLVQCLHNLTKKGSDKKIQTTFIENLSKCVQTSDSMEVLTRPSPKPVLNTIENQSVIFVNYDSDSDKRTCSSNTQTDADAIASQCDSFEYYKDDFNVPKNGILKRSSPKSDLAVSSDSSKDIPILGQLISKKQSKSVIGDVERSIELLQKLLKSKKYDEATKKRYIRKIVDKITNTKYSEDSSSSSELFVPKKQQLQDNIPWQPPQLSKFTVKTFSDQFLPSEDEKKSLLVNQSEENKSLDTDRTGTSPEKQQTLSSGSYQSWKEDKTLSEKLLEEKHRGQGDHLIKYALKERQHQIDWIKDEISHLTKLKGLLEKKVQRTTTVYMVSQQHDQNPCNCVCPPRQPRNYVIQTELSSSSSEVPRDYNLYNGAGRTTYRVSESSRTEPVNVSAKIVGDIEVVSDDKTTNIKVKAKKVDRDGSGGFKPKKPSLVGTRNYDTFPRSRMEERVKSPRRVVNGANSKELSLEVPLDSKSSLATKVNDFVNTVKGSSIEEHRCKCMEMLSRLQGPPVSQQGPKIDLERPCHCCGRQDPIKLQTGTIECQTEDCNCCNKEIQTSIVSEPAFAQTESERQIPVSLLSGAASAKSQSLRSKSTSESSHTSTSSSTSSSSESAKSCICCKRKNVTSKRLYTLREKLSDDAYPFCRPCYKQNRGVVYSPNFFTNPAHVCNCYTVVQTKTLDAIKRTISDLNELDRYCTCLDGSGRGSGYCKYCQCKLGKTSKNRNGIAYTLTFEDTGLKEDEERKRHKKKKRHLEEIKIKIPVSYKKKHKDKENKKKKKHSEETEETSSTGVPKRRNYNLQSYLHQNRPDFVEDAETRRNAMNQARTQREELSDYNKMMFLKKCQEECEKNAKRLFSDKEMKEITKRNYKKLPEVQKKKNDIRDKQLKQASRLMADTFNRKLRENVLKGKKDLPLDAKVVDY